MRKWDDCNGCGGVGVNTINCTSCNGSGKHTEPPSCAQTLLVNRDQYELYKEAAEKWAKDKISEDKHFTTEFGDAVSHETWVCGACNRSSSVNVVHTADCKAARILGLKMEGA